jgi:hypothetical protein
MMGMCSGDRMRYISWGQREGGGGDGVTEVGLGAAGMPLICQPEGGFSGWGNAVTG